MDELIRQYPVKVLSLAAVIVGGLLGGLYKLGWLRFSEKKWDGSERRRSEPCDQHTHMSNKVCALYTKIEAIDSKLDQVAEKLQFVLGTLEVRWGSKGR